MRGLPWSVLGGAVLLLPEPAAAQPATPPAREPVELVWDAPANCPQRDAVRARLLSIAGPALRRAEPLRAEGNIVHADGRYRLSLSVRENGQLRTRRMESLDCSDLAGAAAVALGLLLRQRPETEPAGTATNTKPPGPDTQPPSPTPGADNGSNPASAPPLPTSPEPAPVTVDASAARGDQPPPEDENPDLPTADDGPPGERRWNGIVRAPVVTLDLGPLPKASVGAGGALGVRWGAFRVVVGARLFFEQEWLMPGTFQVGADVSRFQVDGAFCRGWATGRFEFSPCLTLGLERIGARGKGPRVAPNPQQSLSFVIGAAGTAHFYLHDRVALFASAGLGLETTRPRLVVEGLGEIGHTRPLQFSVGLGPEWIF